VVSHIAGMFLSSKRLLVGALFSFFSVNEKHQPSPTKEDNKKMFLRSDFPQW